MDARVEAIRNNKLIGRGTCSIVDECCSDGDIVAELNEEGITDPKMAVDFYIETEDLHRSNDLEMAVGSGSERGEDLARGCLEEWRERKGEYGE